MSFKRLIYLPLFICTSIILNSCSKTTCYNCATYDLVTFAGNFQNIKDSIFCCENDDTWDEIAWGELVPSDEYLDNNGIPNTYEQGYQLEEANFSNIDLSIYTTGIRIGENTDIDGDGISNENDTDIDGDSIPNSKDTTPFGILDNNNVIEYIVCTKMP